MGAPVKANAPPVDTTERVRRVRELMKQEGVDVYIVRSEDAHSSEYVAECDKRRDFLTGFTGSAGLALITLDKAYLFTDGRYFLQASQQLDSNWELVKTGLTDDMTPYKFIKTKLPATTRIGVDPMSYPYPDAKEFRDLLSATGGAVVSLSVNIGEKVWEESSTRPKRDLNAVTVLSEDFCGKSFESKVEDLVKTIKEEGGLMVVKAKLDDIAWLFNLRGTDVEYNPVFFSYAWIPVEGDPVLFIHAEQVSEDLKKHLSGKVKIEEYQKVREWMETYTKSVKKDEKVLLGVETSVALVDLFASDQVKLIASPIALAKAVKNSKEIEGFRQSHIRDGAALVSYFAWLEEELLNGKEISEVEGADELERRRSQLKHYRGLSFNTISSTGSNAAIIHYSPDRETCPLINKDEIYLCDSGAQFTDGTTDVTRTLHFTTPKPFEKRAFTRVLQGHIAIDQVVFPTGTTGYRLDPLARRALWSDGLDYRHGTGHGVGHFLNVHEGPQGIGMRIAFNNAHLVEGMVLSNEPGYYEDGAFGIRIENLVVVQPTTPPNNFGNQKWFRFERLTMAPIQTKLIDTSILTLSEKEWVNNYHKEVFEKVSPLLEDMKDERALNWLKRECREI
ncbi:putative aminopeptidase P, cytoplasmic [Atractiella rhizophila]|nr:putative aminopeptidase P, cytoplasmic [Atractiella rhizophila]